MKYLFEAYQPSELIETYRIINTPGDIAKRSLLYVQETGYLKSIKSHKSERKNLSSYLFLIVLSGKGTFTYGNNLYELQQNDCVLIDCMQHYTHQSDENIPWELLWVHYNGTAAMDYYQQFAKTNEIVFHPNNPEEYIKLIQQLLDLHRDKPSSWEFLSSKLIVDLLTYCLTTKQSSEMCGESINEKIYSIKQFLDQNFVEKITLDDLEVDFYISKYHLCREFKRIYGSSIMDYITVKRITFAKEELRFTNKSIEEIAANSGYPDASYFNKVFRKVESMTASEYRKKWRG